jgi:predicted nucleic acid-binding protein
LIALVDTSVWSLAFRRKRQDLSSNQQEIYNLLLDLITEDRVRMLGVVRQELLSGIHTHIQFERIRAALRAFPDIELSTEDYEEAARMNSLCRSAGITGSMVDFLICAVAVRRHWAVLTLDQDFQRYGRQIPLKFFDARGA